ncbi:MAG: hypothetical protein ABSC48_15485 [Terracidiphilus sp.]
MAEHDPVLFGSLPLRGEAMPGKFGFGTRDGNHVDANRVIFPIIRYTPDNQIDLLGTGFFISTNGLFVTARHVLQAPFDRRTGSQIFPIAIVQFYESGSYLIRPVLRCAFHPVADLTVGVAAPMKRNSDGASLANPILALTTVPADPHSHVFTFAYPRYESVRHENIQILNVIPAYYDGEIIEYLPNGRTGCFCRVLAIEQLLQFTTGQAADQCFRATEQHLL